MTTLRCAFAVLVLALVTGCQTTNDLQVLPHLFGGREPVPVADVRESFAEAKAADPDLRLGFFRAPWSYDFTVDGSTVANEEALLDALESNVGDWTAPTRRAFRHGDWLVVFQDEQTMGLIRPWLDGYEEKVFSQSTLVEVEFRILSAPSEAWMELLGVPRDSSIHVSESQLDALDGDSRVRTITAPRLAVFDGQRGNVQIVNQRAYVADYDVYTVDDEVIADPVIQVLHEGIVIDVRPTLEDNGLATLDVSAVTSELLEMRPTKVELSADETVEIELPLVDTREVESKLVVTPGEWSFLRFGDSEQLLLLRCEVLEP